MSFTIENIVRENIRDLIPYSSARHEYTGSANIFLDANENAFGSPLPVRYNRYPDPMQEKLKEKIGAVKGIPSQNIFIGNGSDEAIDLLFRICCRPGIDNVLVFPPTYGMYQVCADINNVETRNISLLGNFQLDLATIEKSIDENTKIIFVCSPNNPTGNSIHTQDIEVLLNNFDGLVVVDEAYINFAKQKTLLPALTEYANLVILQTLSKAWGLAGLRIGMAFAGEPVIRYFNNVKFPYNISAATQELAIEALGKVEEINNWTVEIVRQRESLSEAIAHLHFVEVIYPSDANFILVKMKHARMVYEFLRNRNIIVRDRSNVILCDNCLRITVGTPAENQQLLETLKNYSE